jgi:hypothetical protein
LVRDRDSDFDKTDLRDELKRAGFEDCIADNIADRVDDRKAHGWTYGVGRQEAIREAQLLLDSSHAALDNFREGLSGIERERRYYDRERINEPERERSYETERERERDHEPLSRKIFG